MSNFQISAHFFLQLAFILATCRIVGFLARKVGQPQVVGEMIAGVMMGPSLLGLIIPDAQNYLFPKSFMSIIYAVSQLGLVLYMFLIGLEFEVGLIRSRLRSAVAVSLAGIAMPFALGSLTAVFLFEDSRYFTKQVTLWESMLFIGAAMSITAFPMLARIIHECGLAGTSLGTLALAAGSLNDVAAWCILAIVLASFNSDASIAIWAIGGGLLYAAGVYLIGRPLFKRLEERARSREEISGAVFSTVLILLMFGAWLTDTIGIYAIFGAFILGVNMPRGDFALEIQRKLEPLTVNFLLPLFFIYSGLNTSIGLLDSISLWYVALILLLGSCLGKGIACWLAARLSGEPNREALAIGALMNSRGLMELIILNIGLERGMITPTLFTILVLMAVVTTLMTSPIFETVFRRGLTHKPA